MKCLEQLSIEKIENNSGAEQGDGREENFTKMNIYYEAALTYVEG